MWGGCQSTWTSDIPLWAKPGVAQDLGCLVVSYPEPQFPWSGRIGAAPWHMTHLWALSPVIPVEWGGGTDPPTALETSDISPTVDVLHPWESAQLWVSVGDIHSLGRQGLSLCPGSTVHWTVSMHLLAPVLGSCPAHPQAH